MAIFIDWMFVWPLPPIPILNSYSLPSTPSTLPSDGIRWWGFGELISIQQGHELKPSWMKSVLLWESWRAASSLCSLPSALWGYKQNSAIYNLTSILTSDVQFPELWERNVLFSHRSMTFCCGSLNWLTQPPPGWLRDSTQGSTPSFVAPTPAQGWDPDLLGEGMAMAHWMTRFLWYCVWGTC